MNALLEMQGISKHFTGVKALSEVSFTVAEGEIHALVGENGAGKSTLMKVLSGVYPHGSYEGSIVFDGEERRFRDINDSEVLGIIIIHQELALIPLMSIAENIFLVNSPARLGVIDRGAVHRRTLELLAKVGLDESPDTLITDIVEVAVFAATGGPTLAGAVELVSPANKDRPAHRDAFVSKCASYLQQGIGLVIVDVVTERGGNLHDALLARLASAEPPFDAALYATAYRPNGHGGEPRLDIWQEELAVGQALPTLPLCLRGGVTVPVELEATYERTCREQRVLANGN